MEKPSILLLVVLGLFASCSSLRIPTSQAVKESINPLLGSWVNVVTHMYGKREETATNPLAFDDSTFDLSTMVIGEDYTEETSEGGEYTYTGTTLTLNYFFHSNAAGEPFYGDELPNGPMEDRTILFGYVLTESGPTIIPDVEGQLFIKQQAIWICIAIAL